MPSWRARFSMNLDRQYWKLCLLFLANLFCLRFCPRARGAWLPSTLLGLIAHELPTFQTEDLGQNEALSMKKTQRKIGCIVFIARCSERKTRARSEKWVPSKLRPSAEQQERSATKACLVHVFCIPLNSKDAILIGTSVGKRVNPKTSYCRAAGLCLSTLIPTIPTR